MDDYTPTVTPRIEFRAETNFQRVMANGHLNRTGHTLVGYYAANCDGILGLIRTCC